MNTDRHFLVIPAFRSLSLPRLLALLGCFAASLCPAFGESAPTGRQPELNVRFAVFAAQPVGALAYAAGTGQAERKLALRFYPSARSPRYEYRGPAPLRFYDAKSGDVVAEADIPAGVAEPLLIFSPQPAGATGGLRYFVYVFDDAASRYGAGKLLVLNFTGMRLAGTVGSRKVALQDGPNGPFDIGGGAAVQFRTEFKKRSYRAYGGTVEAGRSERALLLLLPPFYKGSLEVQSRLLVEELTAPR